MRKISLKSIGSTDEQRKILIIAGIIALAFVIFITLIYLPQKKRFENLKKELRAMETEIREVKRAVGVTGDESMVKSLDALLKRFKTLNEKFPLKDEAILRELANYAHRCGIEVKTIQPQKKRAIANIDGTEVSIAGYSIEELNISILALGTYKNFGEYVRLLKKDFPALIRINSLQFTGSAQEGKNIVNIGMSVTAYVLSPASKGM